MSKMKTGTLYFGDCLEVMKEWADQSVDLIYLDPPFNSKTDYNILFGTAKDKATKNDLAQMTAFKDTWEWNAAAAARVRDISNAVAHPAHLSIQALATRFPQGSGMLAYCSYMAQRLAIIKRLLKDTGSIYLHCDPTASHYLKMLMDEIFGAKNFRNEIIWHYYNIASTSKAFFGRKHDIIFCYSAGKPTFNVDEVREPYTETSNWVKHGGYSNDDRYKPHDKGRLPHDVWRMPTINNMAKERLGYPTQKPIALLDRIIKASSNEGDLVLDPFCGCGTTVEAAQNLNRKWIGIDITSWAIRVIRRERLKDMRIPITGLPKDTEAAQFFAENDRLEFEKWAVTLFDGLVPNDVQTGDGGVDGRGTIYGLPEKPKEIYVQVKSGATPSLDSLGRLCGLIASNKAAIGIFITMRKWDTPSVRKAVTEAGVLAMGATKFNRLMMYSIDEYFQGIEPKLPPMAHPHTGKPLQLDLMGAGIK